MTLQNSDENQYWQYWILPLAGPTRGGTRGTLYPGPVPTRAQEDGSTHITSFCNQDKNY